MENIENRTIRDLIAMSLVLVAYSIIFYLLHIKNREEYYTPNGEGGIKGELKAYFKCEGKYLLIIYGVLSVLCEINFLIPTSSPGKVFPLICMPFFPFSGYIPIPIVRSIISLVIIAGITALLVIVNFYRIKKLCERNKRD